MRRTVLAVGAAVALTAAATGCGSSGGGGSKPAAKPAGDPGKALFTSVGCSNCHTLAAAGAKGHVGPDLDTLKPSDAAVLKQVTNGGGGMPAFKGQLSSAQIRQVAAYVAKVAGQ